MKYLLLRVMTCVSVISLILPPQIARGQQDTRPTQEIQAYEASVLQSDPEAEKIAYENWVKEQFEFKLVTKAEQLQGTKQGQCVIAVRRLLGVGRETIQGAAKNLKTDADEPEVGAIVKMRGSKWGHVAVVLKVEENRIYIFESNYNFRERARTVWISRTDNRILGYKIINQKETILWEWN